MKRIEIAAWIAMLATCVAGHPMITGCLGCLCAALTMIRYCKNERSEG